MKRHLRLIVSNRADPKSAIDTLYDQYCAAHARWYATRSEAARVAARDAYNAWARAFLGGDSKAVEISAAQIWGVA